jgi:hypothetical protein
MTLESTLDATVDGDVEFQFRVVNAGRSPIELQFRSGKTADVAAFEDGEEVWRWSTGRLFTQALQSWTLAPGESNEQRFTWTDPQPGTYTARATLEGDRSAEATTTLEI